MKGKKIIKTQYILELNEQEIKDLRRIVRLYGDEWEETDDKLYASSTRFFHIIDGLVFNDN